MAFGHTVGQKPECNKPTQVGYALLEGDYSPSLGLLHQQFGLHS